MDFINKLDSKTPKINVSKNKVVVDLSVTSVFSIKIENISEGYLQGNIFADSVIKLSSDVINKNQIILECAVDKEKCANIKKYLSFIKIISNGGDLYIEVEILNETKPLVINNTYVYNVKDFYEYYKKHTEICVQYFANPIFYDWLNFLDKKYADIYNFVDMDNNEYRKIDNFFILTGYKTKSVPKIIDRLLVINVLPFSDNEADGVLTFEKEDVFVEFSLTSSINKDLIIFEKNVYSNVDFDENNRLNVYFKIDLSKIKSKSEEIFLLINNDINNKICIKIKNRSFVKLKTDKTIYKDKDTGIINIKNFSKKSLSYEIIKSSNNIIIPDQSGVFDKEIDIDFVIKLSTFNTAVVKFFKKPYFTTKLTLYFYVENIRTKKEIVITIGTDNLELD